MSRRLLSVAATGALLLGLAACGDGSEEGVSTPPPDLGIDAPSDGGGDTPDPSDGGGETTTEDPTAAAPDIPPPDPADFAGMEEHTEEGAIQAFRYYIAVVMWAHQTGDDSKIDNLVDVDCESCREFMKTFEELEAHGELWGEFSLNDESTMAHESQNFDFEVAYKFRTTPHERPTDDFSGRVDVGSLEYSTVGGMVWTGEAWLIGGLSADWGDDVLA